jgi:dinuclear metal center YbgI/SA1388 family protein
MIALQDVVEYLEAFAPHHLAEEWDNVGLLVGAADAQVGRIMTCLTVTPESAAEAIQQQVDLVVTHHPLPFRPLKRITTDTNEGRMLLELIVAGVAIYSPHTAFDSASGGINQQLAEGLALDSISPLVEFDDGGHSRQGTGRQGFVEGSITLNDLAQRVKQFLGIPHLRRVGSGEQPVGRVAIACGSGGSLLEAAIAQGCTIFVTGETSFHTCLAAQAAGIGLLLPGHYATERFAVESLARRLDAHFQELSAFASQQERDPLELA